MWRAWWDFGCFRCIYTNPRLRFKSFWSFYYGHDDLEPRDHACSDGFIRCCRDLTYLPPSPPPAPRPPAIYLLGDILPSGPWWSLGRVFVQQPHRSKQCRRRDYGRCLPDRQRRHNGEQRGLYCYYYYCCCIPRHRRHFNVLCNLHNYDDFWRF